jgi:hypothetical protein
MLHAYYYTICLVFHYTLWRFYAIYGTNLLTRCHSVSSLFYAVFVFQKSYTGNILGIGRNDHRNPYFSWSQDEDRKGVGGGAEGWLTIGWRAPSWPRPLVVRPPWSTSDDALSPIKSFRIENPKTISKISRRVPQLRRRHRWISGNKSLCSGTLPGRGSAKGNMPEMQ